MSHDTHTAEWIIDKLTKLADNQHPQISVGELIQAEVIINKNSIVQQLAKDISALALNFIGNLSSLTPCRCGACDGWWIGYNDRFPQKWRIQQALVFADRII